ncbi:MAG TPA: hypothetical protein DGD08_08550 [Gemmatimonas aurantiaca]|uniref:Uncharacterized protein n=2 Tax=Gemmatimonas aurantiaca TaxID=173480 RepID=C1A442_GEMAT|nr:hypothetical protein [Gemmatimonas aurantiaca]BAH38867.1 hypothetical protein GAU_1825 [Gemmatimonas aurantiaca T-27]HCT57248.1 hypothetical protein [Gemmatimonas aurantiaca]
MSETETATAAENETDDGQDLLTLPEKTAAKRLSALWDALEDPMRQRVPKWERNRLSRRGIRGVRVLGAASARDDSDGVWVPPGATDQPPVPNNVDQLTRRIVDTITSDEPKIEAVSPSPDDLDIEAAEQATRILEHEDAAAASNLRKLVQKALNRAGTYSSSFSFQYVDQYGLLEPIEVLAHPLATDPENPLVDPQTGMPAAGPFETRYVVVGADGQKQLSASRKGAELGWKPLIREDLLNPHCVRLWPATAEGIDTAEGVFVGRVTTLGAIKASFPDVAELDADELRKLCAWRPATGKKYWAPIALAEAADKSALAMQDRSKGSEQAPPDETIVYFRCLYLRSSRKYPMGAYFCLGANTQLVGRGKWSATVGDGEDEREEPLDLPVAQCRFFEDPADQDPYGLSPVEWLAPMDEAVATQTIAWLEYLYRFNHPNTFLPLGSVIQPGQLNIRDGTPIRYNAAAGKLEYESIPTFPSESTALIDKYEAWMRTLSGLENAARGVADPSVKSGIHAERIIEQALVALTQVVSNVQDFLLRRGRIRLQLIATHYTAPRLLRINGDGGLPQVRAFQGADLRTIRDVRLQRNSMTMLTRSAKVSMLRDELTLGMQANDPSAYLRYRTQAASLTDAIATQDDDPHMQRVQRQVTEWRRGPKEGADPNTIWAVLPVDDDPTVAPMRAYRLGRAIASDRFTKFPPDWNQPLVAAYQAARQAAGMMNAAEQAQSQQQATQAQAQAEAQSTGQQQQMDAQNEQAKQQQAHANKLEEIVVTEQVKTAAQMEVDAQRAAVHAMPVAGMGEDY